MTNTTNNGAEIAETIIAQINHADFWARARWGVKQMLATERGVLFNCTKRIKITITLDASDTYSIEIGRMKGRFDYVAIANVSFIHDDQLVKIIDAEFSRAFGSL